MKTYFCRKISRHKAFKEHIIEIAEMEGELLYAYPIYRMPGIGKWFAEGISMDEIFAMTRSTQKELDCVATYTDGLVYCLVFDEIKFLRLPYPLQYGGPNGQSATQGSPQWWEYTNLLDKQEILCSLNDKQMEDAIKLGKTAILSRDIPQGEMLWNEKSRMA